VEKSHPPNKGCCFFNAGAASRLSCRSSVPRKSNIEHLHAEFTCTKGNNLKTPPPFRLGKKSPRLDARTLHLSKYLLQQGTARQRALPPAPPSVDWTAKIPTWPMFANDTLGDCTIAAAAHMIECWTANAGDAFTPSNAQVIAAYSATGGYIAGDAATDNGAVELDVLNYWRQQGIAGHKIDAYVSFSAQNAEHARQAINLFGGIYIGLALPLSAQNQDVWNVPSFISRMFSIRCGRRSASGGNTDPGSWGGHAVSILAYDPDGLTCITWGAKKRMTWDFFARYCDESYAPLSRDWLNVKGTDPAGLDFAALQADLSELNETAN
jgi:hypothetical protein